MKYRNVKWETENIKGFPRMGDLPKVTENGALIAQLGGGELSQVEANAKLIASAPQMIDALIRINKAIDDMELNDRFGHAQQYVREAIEKALK